MLQGGTTPSNVDPFATQPPDGMDWMQEPPHVMIFNYGDAIQDYPKPGEHAGHDAALGDVGRHALRASDAAGEITCSPGSAVLTAGGGRTIP